LKLSQFCKEYSLYILNGRIGTDKGIGNCTYVSTVGKSVIDYSLATGPLIPNRKFFKIDGRAESKQCPITLNLNAIYTQNEENISNVQNEKDFIKATDVVDSKEHLKSNFTEDFIHDICSKICVLV